MPTGHNLAQCLHCLAEYICGDCITHTCPDCEAKGHRNSFMNCPVCDREAAERRARIDAAIKTSQQ